MIFRTLFGDITSGTVHRVRFFWSILSLVLVALAGVIAVGTLFGLDVDMTGLTAVERQAAVTEALGLIGLVLLVGVGVVVLFAQLNLMAKRVRDTGLPGWTVLAAVILLTAAVSGFVSQNVAGLVNLAFWLALLFTPPGVFRRKG